MFKLGPVVLCLVLLYPKVTIAEQAKTNFVVDGVPESSRIVDVALSDDGSSAIVALQSEVIEYELFPVRAVNRLNVHFQIRAIEMAPNNAILIVGNHSSSGKQLRSNNGYLQVLRKEEKTGRLVKWYIGKFTRSDLFSHVAVGENGVFAIANLTSSSAIFGKLSVFSEQGTEFYPKFKEQRLPCGTPQMLSVFGSASRPALIASIFDEWLIELSYLDGRYSKGCRVAIRVPGDPGRSKLNNPRYTVHSLLRTRARLEMKASDDTYRASIVYVDNTAEEIAVQDLYDRFGDLDYDRPNSLTIAKLHRGFNQRGVNVSLGADVEGRLVVLAGDAESKVLVFTVEEHGLEYHGWLDMGGTVSHVDVSKRGNVTAIVTKAKGSQRIYFLRSLEAAQLNRRLPTPRFTVQWLQQALADQELDPGPIDGHVGVRTIQAIRKLLADGIDISAQTTDQLILKAVEQIAGRKK